MKYLNNIKLHAISKLIITKLQSEIERVVDLPKLFRTILVKGIIIFPHLNFFLS